MYPIKSYCKAILVGERVCVSNEIFTYYDFVMYFVHIEEAG